MRYELNKEFKSKKSRGAVLPMVGVLLIVFLGIAALAIDIGYRNATQNELQNVADAAALAGAGYMGSVYAGGAESNYIFIRSEIVDVVQEVAEKNKAAGVNIVIRDEDITIGKWNADSDFYKKGVNLKGDISPTTLVGPDAVKVIARRDEQANEPIRTFFAQVLGFDTLAVEAEAAAALTGQANFEPGEVKLPFSLSMLQFPDACQEPIAFTSNDDCAAWHTFTLGSINAQQMEDMLYGLIVDHEDGSAWLETNAAVKKSIEAFSSPEVIGGVTSFELTEGVVAKLFTGTPSPMQSLFDFWKTRDEDGDDSVWTTTVPVYKEPGTVCTPTGQSRVIVGAADLVVTGVNGPPGNSIEAVIVCAYKSMRGSGGIGGNAGSIPNLVR